jgi:hypothetical protein
MTGLANFNPQKGHINQTRLRPASVYTYTGLFIMFSMLTNIYNKKTEGPNLMGFFIATGKLKKVSFLQLEMFDVCTTGDTAHVDTIFKLLPHTRQHVDACVATIREFGSSKKMGLQLNGDITSCQLTVGLFLFVIIF